MTTPTPFRVKAEHGRDCATPPPAGHPHGLQRIAVDPAAQLAWVLAELRRTAAAWRYAAETPMPASDNPMSRTLGDAHAATANRYAAQLEMLVSRAEGGQL